MGSAPGLIRFAARYTRSLHDAEDAYQRAMEIALTRAPVTEQRRFMAWLHTVLRNEALAVARVRRREGPGVEADVTEAYEDTLESAARIDAIAEWRERYRSIQDGLAGLTDAQRICLMLQTAGVSYERIREITGFSLRKVERSVLEGRSRLAAWEVRLASGEACERLDPVIGRVASGQATAKEARVVSRHVRHCGHCRAVLRDRRESNEWRRKK
jgi:RNA polymerase sigma factor (sigma-70 family)